MQEESEFLKRRASEFWQRAKEDFQKQRYNLSAFDVEQAVQLWLKYLLFLKAGDFPKTHYLKDLIETFLEIYNLPRLRDFFQASVLELKSLEDAYLTSRYLPREFSRQEAEKFIEFASKIFKTLAEATNEKFITN